MPRIGNGLEKRRRPQVGFLSHRTESPQSIFAVQIYNWSAGIDLQYLSVAESHDMLPIRMLPIRASSKLGIPPMQTRLYVRQWLWLAVFISTAFVSSVPIPAIGELVRFEILKREPFADGMKFGQAGAYERIVGRVFYELDPDLEQNAAVVDLCHAPRNERGRVEFFADLFILAPQDPAKSNGALLYDVNNRGNMLALAFFNYGQRSNAPMDRTHAGDGFLMRHGFTLVWSGWDGELLPGGDRLRLAPPAAVGKGRPIIGPVRCEIVPTSNVKRMVVNWANHGAYRPTAQGVKTATLTHRVRPVDPRIPIPREQWQLHVTDVDSDHPDQLPKVELELATGGLQQGHIYELIYEARDPVVMGTGFTAVRDLISALKYGTGSGNPLVVDGKPWNLRAHGFGVSQSGRFLREFVYWGFNEDEHGRQMFDGVIPHVAGGGLGSFNHRFAQPTRHVTQHDHHDYPADRFPFTYETLRDPLSGQTDGILRRSVSSGTAPLVMHTQSEAEYWTRSGSVIHTDPLGKQDSQLPAGVRVYAFGGTQHGPASFPPSRGSGQNLTNPADYKVFLRALLLRLDAWSRNGQQPPASVYPTIAAGTLVDWQQASTGFPKVPGVRYPLVIQQPSFWDYGPRWLEEQIIDRQPPVSQGDYRVLVPRCDADGNVLGCLLPPEVAVPVATYTGWNLRSAQAGAENELVSLQGSYIPFTVTAADRRDRGDPRLSLQERYGSRAEYLERLTEACRNLQQSGYMLEEDVARTMAIQEKRIAELFSF